MFKLQKHFFPKNAALSCHFKFMKFNVSRSHKSNSNSPISWEKENYFNLSEGKICISSSGLCVTYGYPKINILKINKFCRFAFGLRASTRTMKRYERKASNFKGKLSVGVFVLELIAELLSKHIHRAPLTHYLCLLISCEFLSPRPENRRKEIIRNGVNK